MFTKNFLLKILKALDLLKQAVRKSVKNLKFYFDQKTKILILYLINKMYNLLLYVNRVNVLELEVTMCKEIFT